jgi:hypothetical protein
MRRLGLSSAASMSLPGIGGMGWARRQSRVAARPVAQVRDAEMQPAATAEMGADGKAHAEAIAMGVFWSITGSSGFH